MSKDLFQVVKPRLLDKISYSADDCWMWTATKDSDGYGAIRTVRENVHRGMGKAGINARKTHCKNGHDLSKSSYLYPYRGTLRRICKECW